MYNGNDIINFNKVLRGKAGSRGSPACVTDVLTHKVSDSLLPSTLTDLRLMRKRIISQQILIKPGE